MPSILDPKFQYVPASSTNVRETFRRHGWVGPEERRNTKSPFVPADMVGVTRYMEGSKPPITLVEPSLVIGGGPGPGFPVFM